MRVGRGDDAVHRTGGRLRHRPPRNDAALPCGPRQLATRGGSLERVLDVGAGSGILGIAAAVLGAGHVDAVEIDPLVHDAIRGNARRNGVAERMMVSAAMPAGAGLAYPLVFANIVAEVLLAEAAAVCSRLRRGAPAEPAGCLILSGLLDADVAAVTECYQRHLGVEPTHSSRGDWHCLRFVC